MNKFLNVLQIAAYILLVIGALNWGLVGLMEFDLVAFLFGDMTLLAKSVYILIGLAALISLIITFVKMSARD